jgi:DNA-binding protein H-NS
MAKKRRGRPPGSKNKAKGRVTISKLAKACANYSVPGMRDEINALQKILSDRIQEERAAIEQKIAELDGGTAKGIRRVDHAIRQAVGLQKRAKVMAKYRSRKDPKLIWSGCGMTAGWLKEEMKATGKPKEYLSRGESPVYKSSIEAELRTFAHALGGWQYSKRASAIRVRSGSSAH